MQRNKNIKPVAYEIAGVIKKYDGYIMQTENARKAANADQSSIGGRRKTSNGC